MGVLAILKICLSQSLSFVQEVDIFKGGEGIKNSENPVDIDVFESFLRQINRTAKEEPMIQIAKHNYYTFRKVRFRCSHGPIIPSTRSKVVDSKSHR